MTPAPASPLAFVVNDDQTQLILLAGLLRKEGLEAQTFPSAADALAALEHSPAPDLIVTDLYMPGIDGWRFCRLLRSADYPACNQIPILVVSATYAGDEADRIAADLGANGFLPSPVDGKRFLAIVRSLLAGEQAKQALRVLIVEDNPAQAKLFWKAFADRGYQTDVAPTVAAAVEAFSAEVYDLAILDYHLPDGDGGMLLDRLKEMQSHCVFLMMTAESSPDLALDLMQRGAAAFLRKPFNPTYLIEVAIRARRERTLLRVEDLLETRTRELRASEERFRSIAQNAFDLVCLIDDQGRYLFCNDAYQTILGYDPADLVGRSCFDLVSPQDREGTVELYHAHKAANATPAPFTLRILHRQGQERTIHYQVKLLQEGNHLKRILLNGRDITSQQQNEQALFRRTALLEALAEATTILLQEKNVLVALDRVIQIIGQASGQDRAYLFTITADPATGEDLASMRHEWVRPGVSEEINNPLMRDLPMQRQSPFLYDRLRAGLMVSCRVSDLPSTEQRLFLDQGIVSLLLVPIYIGSQHWGFIGFDKCRTEYGWTEGEQSALVSLTTSITSAVQRTRAEEELRSTRDRMTTAFDSLDASIHVTDVASRNIVYANESCKRIFGDDILGRRCWEVFHHAAEPCPDCPCEQPAPKKRNSRVEDTTDLFSTANGRWYYCRTKPILWEDGRPALLRIATDITERKQTESFNQSRMRLLESASDLSLEAIQVVTLDEIEDLTGSRIGFFHFVGDEEASLWLQAWSTRTSELCRIEGKGLRYSLEEAGVWVDCIRQRQPVIHNEYPTLAHRKGIPHGHVEVTRLLTAPVTRNKRIVAILGIGNKPQPYSDADLDIVTRMAELAWDLCERKQAEMALVAGKEEYQRLYSMLRLMADTMPDMLWAKNVNKEFLFANKALCRDLLNATDTSEPLGKTDVFFAGRERESHPDDPPWHTFGELCMDSDAATLEAMSQMQFDEYGNVKGKYLHLDVHKAPLFNDQGELIGVVGSARDITERKHAEVERDQLVLAIEQTSETIVITDTTGAIVFANPAFERITGYSREEALGLNPRILKSGKHDESFYAEMWATLQRGEGWSGRVINKRKDGSLFTEEAFISPVLDRSGATVNYVAVKRDITDSIRQEEQLRQAQKLESIGQLAGGVAHDFNNMLGVILGRVEMAMARLEPSHPVGHHLKDIRQAAERSTELTRQLLTFARKQAITPKVLDLNEVIAAMLKILQRLIGESIELTWRPGNNLWPVLIDPTQVDQILANLCVNARDAIKGVGTITIATGTISVDEHDQCGLHGLEPEGYVRLSVCDDGCGMDQETIAHIFEPFFTTKAVGVGTGLGLATVYGIVNQNKGYIDVQSTPGQGSTFSILLPKAPGTAGEDSEKHQGHTPERGQETILLVEDEPLILTMAQSMLEMLGYTVLVAQTPGEAMHKATNHPERIDLLLSDVIMPEMSGLDLAQRMQLIRPGLKCLFMSGYTADILDRQTGGDEPVDLIEKPFMLQDLAAKVRAVLARM